MPTLHIGPAVSEKTGTPVKGFSFIVMGDLLAIEVMKHIEQNHRATLKLIKFDI